MCHRSQRAYSRLLWEEIGSGATYGFDACSGAVTANVLTTPQWSKSSVAAQPQWPDSYVYGDQPQLADLRDFGSEYGKPDVITLTMGGNDAKFADIIENCLMLSCSDEPLASAILNDAHNIFENEVKALKAIRDASSNSEVYVLAYPSPASPDTPSCVVYPTDPEKTISRDERAWLRDTLIPYLNRVVQATGGVKRIKHKVVEAAGGPDSRNQRIHSRDSDPLRYDAITAEFISKLFGPSE